MKRDHSIIRQLPPQEILAIRPSPEMQARFSELLALSKSGTITPEDEVELEWYLLLEHQVRLAKGRALKTLSQSD